METEFRCKKISKQYSTRNGVVAALDQLDLDVRTNEFLCIVGPSGCGKTTLLKLIAGIQSPTSGSIQFDRPRATKNLRSAMVFQDHGLFPWMSLLDNVAFGLETQGVETARRRRAAREWLQIVGMAPFAKNYPHELSVGMRQRAALGRAFLADTPILLMDEPFSALDAQMRVILQGELMQYWTARKQTVVYVTHDIDEALRLGDRVLLMSRRPGRILEECRVPLTRPRLPQDLASPEIAAIKQRIWEILQGEVQPGLGAALP